MTRHTHDASAAPQIPAPSFPTPPRLVAGVVALWLLAAVLRRPTSPPRLFAEAFVTRLAVIAAVWASWVILWLIERRW